MKRFALLVLATIGVAMPSIGYGQTSAPSAATPNNTPVTGMRPDRTTASPAARQKMQQRESALRKKRAECRQQARDQKISLLKRRSFIRDCMNH